MNKPLKTCFALAALLFGQAVAFAQFGGSTPLSCPNGQSFSVNRNECSCPSGMMADDKNTCGCKVGFALAPAGTYCLRLPAHAHGDTNDANGWSCDAGYRKQGSSCTKTAASGVMSAPKKVTTSVRGQSASRNRRSEGQLRRSKASTKTQQSNSSQSSGATSFPINLLNNQQWKIVIITPANDFLGYQEVLHVERDNDRMSVLLAERDLKTGQLTEKGLSADYYKARFRNAYFAPQEPYLQLYRCWYKYKYIQADFTCHSYNIPVKLTGNHVKGDEDFSTLIDSANNDFTVEVLSKSSTEIPCNVKGEVYQKEHIYHLQDGTFYDELESGFRCFLSEQEAIGAGYKKSLR